MRFAGYAALAGAVVSATACAGTGAAATALPPAPAAVVEEPVALPAPTGDVNGTRERPAPALPVSHPRRSSLLGIDKLKHFLVAGYVESVTYAGMQAAGADREMSLAAALGAVGIASVGKEMHDRRSGQGFSVLDLVWDALGAGAAWLILAKTQR